MTVFARDVIRIDGSGNLTHVDLQITGTGVTFESEAPGDEFRINGVSLGPDAPVLERGVANYTFADGTSASKVTVHFSDGVNDYYFLKAEEVNTSITSLIDWTFVAVVGSYHQAGYGINDENASSRTGDSLTLKYDGGVLSSMQVSETVVMDDDNTITTTGTEVGDSDFGFVFMPYWVNHSMQSDEGTGDTNVVLVELNFTTAGGSGTMDAIRIEANYGGTIHVTYIPQNGHVDLALITEITNETISATSLEGANWSDYGLSDSPILDVGTSGSDVMIGTIRNERFNGKGGADSLFGDVGEDRLYGGGGKDYISGGAQNDYLNGNGGNDTLYGNGGKDDLIGGGGKDGLFGGIGHDLLKGGDGDDVLRGGVGSDDLHGGVGSDILIGGVSGDELFGGKGKDTLKGGTGQDELYGGAGDDVLKGGDSTDILDGGKGIDKLFGGDGADVFIFISDGVKDYIQDFQDGVDIISLDSAFASLTITDNGAGIVKIAHDGEKLFVTNSAADLTAADFTTADFF